MNEDPGMKALKKSSREILLEFNELRAKLNEAEQTLEAIRTGDVDALVVYGEEGEKVYTLRGADEPYRIFVENMQEGAVTLSEEGTVLYCNQSFARMTGLALERVIGGPIDRLLFGREGESFEDVRANLASQSTRAEMVVLQTGRELPVQVSFSSIDSDGPETIAITVTDLSAQREHENQLQRANDELEGFCYSVAHDLRAPLRNIIGAANIVLEDMGPQLPEAGRLDLEQIAQSASYLGNLIDDLLAYSRLSRSEVDSHPIDLTALAKDIAQGPSLKELGAASWTIQEGMRIRGDEGLIRLALENLMSNAVKYSQKSAKPRVEIGYQTTEGSTVYFIRDNGIGFEMTYAERIFRPFERLHRHSEYPGTGIGLANARRVITKHGGEIWAESHPERGAVFYFTVPTDEGLAASGVTEATGASPE